MAIPRAQYATNISDRLSELAMKVKARSRANLTDANRVIEPIVCRLFNALFGWQLINLNSERPNFPAADLGDRMQRIAVQVTNEESSDKIAQTSQKAQEHSLGAEFDRLIVFFLLQRKPGWPRTFIQPASGPVIETWDIADILNQAHEQHDLAMIKRASEVLDEELRSLDSPTADPVGFSNVSREGHRFDHGTYGLNSSPESLYTSFFEVAFPSVIQQAQISLKRGSKFGERLSSLWSALKTKDVQPVDFHIEHGVVYTFDSFDRPIWQALIADRAIKPLASFSSATWADSVKQADRNLFIKLLQRNLEQLCNHVGTAHKLAYSKELKCYLFQAETDKARGTIKVPAIKKSGTREVFKAIPNSLPERKGEVQHWKHQAFRHKFVCFGGDWHLNIEPFWAFTCDGKISPSRWHKTSSRNMKKPERNRAVLGHIMFWASLLCKEPDMLSYPVSIRILRPSKIDASPSIQDEAWKVIAPADERAILTTDGLEELLIL